MDQNQSPELEAKSAPAEASLADVDKSERRQVGPIIVTLVIILVLIIAGLYLFATKLNQQPVPLDDTDTMAQAAPAAAEPVPEIYGTADDPQSLQDDLDKSTSGLENQNF